MKNYEELEARFDEIPELAIDEETIGAYLENNLTAEQYDAILNLLEEFPELNDFIQDLGIHLLDEPLMLEADEVEVLNAEPAYEYQEEYQAHAHEVTDADTDHHDIDHDADHEHYMAHYDHEMHDDNFDMDSDNDMIDDLV